jgi:uncharacterized membrane protein YbhN (UPF0104 family)
MKHWSWTFLRLVLCVAALGYVFSRTDLHDKVWLKDKDAPVRLVHLDSTSARIVQADETRTVPLHQLQTADDGGPRVSWGLASLASRSNKSLFLLAILIYGVQPLLQVTRFRWMLRLQNLRIDWSAAATICFAGNFYNYVMPGTTGGDLVRVGYLMRSNSNRHGSLVAIILDRLTGLAGLLALAGAAGLLIPIQQPAVRNAARVSLVVFACMVVGFAAVTGWQWITRLLGRMPLGIHLQQLYDAASAGKRGWPLLLAAVGLTVVLQAAAMASFSVAAMALGMAPAWGQYFVCLPISLVVAAIPIVPMGLGTMEAAMMALLLAGHVGSPSQILGLALAMRMMGLIWAMPGGLVPLLRGATPVASAADR